MTFTPRILDDTWLLLWNHVLEPSAPSIGLPIAGRIEFDIDMIRARWFSSWITSRVTEPVVIAPSRASRDFTALSQMNHSLDMSANNDSGEKAEDQPITTARPRHVPKTLSLVERYDAFVPKTPLNQLLAVDLPNVEPTPSIPFLALPPVESSNKDLAMKVNQWRTGAMDADEGLVTTRAISGSITTDEEEIEIEIEAEEEELNLADFSWSPSTAGPPTGEDNESIMSGARLPSVHLDRRMGSSVCVTPSVCTSFGPPDDDYMHSSSPVALRTPFPNRYGPGSCPNTPSTATTWGPPSAYPPSPEVAFYVRTPDIAHRSFDEARMLPRRGVFTWPYYTPSNEPVASVVEARTLSRQGVFTWPYYTPSNERVASTIVLSAAPSPKTQCMSISSKGFHGIKC